MAVFLSPEYPGLGLTLSVLYGHNYPLLAFMRAYGGTLTPDTPPEISFLADYSAFYCKHIYEIRQTRFAEPPWLDAL